MTSPLFPRDKCWCSAVPAGCNNLMSKSVQRLVIFPSDHSPTNFLQYLLSHRREGGLHISALSSHRSMENRNILKTALVGIFCYVVLLVVHYQCLQQDVFIICSCSQVLLASGVPPDVASNAIRLSIGRSTTKSDIDVIVNDLKAIVNLMLAEKVWPVKH